MLVPTAPVAGVAPDSVRLRAAPVFEDAGQKSIVIEQLATSDPRAILRAGSQDTVFLEITDILRQWRGEEELPRTMVLSIAVEGSGVIEGLFSSSIGTSPPAVRVTFIPQRGVQ